MSFSSVRPMTSDARVERELHARRDRSSARTCAPARCRRSDRGPSRPARESGSSAAPRRPTARRDGLGLRGGRAAACGCAPGAGIAAAGVERGQRRRGRRQRLRHRACRGVAPAARLLRHGGRAGAASGTAGDPGGVSTGTGAGVCCGGRAADERRRVQRTSRDGRAPRERRPLGGHGGDRRARRDRHRSAHRRQRRGDAPACSASSAGRDRAVGSARSIAAQHQLVVADLDLVPFAQRRRRRDLRPVDPHAGEAGEILDVERAVLPDQPRVPARDVALRQPDGVAFQPTDRSSRPARAERPWSYPHRLRCSA